ncbi:MAG TPA: efflux RND transporter periplasmic adaptor subunit [Rubrivivax sp.]|nr:efflux RND transporter periplasmic adaptor subunit [Rubrivivax sp.]
MAARPLIPSLLMALGLLLQAPAALAAAPQLATAPVRSSGAAALSGFDGVVEAVRQTVVAAQVAGAVTSLDVKAGDAVRAGQVLARIDARTAEQSASASDAQLRQAQALLDVAAKDLQRQQQLHQKQYISQAALERAESQFKAAQAQAAALQAQAGAARTQSGLHVLRAPYAGIVADVPVSQGDMALPGRALMTLYEPGALRVSAAVPHSAWNPPVQGVRVEFPGLPEARRWLDAREVQRLPAVDAATHTVQLRIALPPGIEGVAPGLFARVWLPDSAGAQASARLYVPRTAVVRRAEMSGVYVVDDQGAALLRYVRLGRALGGEVEILSGVSAGERVALDAQAAARQGAEERR